MQTNKTQLLSLYSAFMLSPFLSPHAAISDTELSWTDTIGLSGVVEFEAFSLDGPDGDESDADLATVELGIDAQITDSVAAYSLLLIEAPDHDVELDEAGLILSFGASSLNLGKQYLPFGSFESHLISDPLTLEIGEANESAAVLGFESDAVSGSVYLFNGDVDETGEDNSVNNFGASIGYGSENFEIGLGYINSLVDSDSLGEVFEDGGIADYPAGIALHGIAEFSDYTLIGEYLTASDAFLFEGISVEPSAYNLEVGYAFELAGKEASIALAVQGTEDSLLLELPEKRTLVGLSVAILPSTSLSFEYANNDDYSVAEGGSGEDSNTFTVQVAVEF